MDGTFDDPAASTCPCSTGSTGSGQLPDLSVEPSTARVLGPAAVPGATGTVVELGEATPGEPCRVASGSTPVWTVTGTTTIAPTQPGAQVAFVVEEDADSSVTLTDTLVGQGRLSIAKAVDDAGLGSPVHLHLPAVGGRRPAVARPRRPLRRHGPRPDRRAPNSVVELVEVPPADPAGGTWTAPTWTVTGARTATPEHGGFAFTVGRGSAVSAVQVTNVVEPDPVVLGGFAVRKVVAGATTEVPLGARFTGTWSCTAAGATGASSGTWSVGGRRDRRRRRVPRRDGPHCCRGRGPARRHVHVDASPAGGRVVVAAGDPAVVGLVTATNTYDDGAELAATGADGVEEGTTVAAALALVLGAVLTLTALCARRPLRAHD